MTSLRPATRCGTAWSSTVVPPSSVKLQPPSSAAAGSADPPEQPAVATTAARARVAPARRRGLRCNGSPPGRAGVFPGRALRLASPKKVAARAGRNGGRCMTLTAQPEVVAAPTWQFFDASVAAVRRLGPNSVRLTLTAPELARFGVAGCDQRFKLVFCRDDAGLDRLRDRGQDW